ncbi:MAG: glycosyltransferase family 2 protein [Alphaproteobacteria bacterium]|nr:glycosyltransferase family 2 protein [Alphaproteobacteria bacterium]
MLNLGWVRRCPPPPGTHDAAGRRRDIGTGELIRDIAGSPSAALHRAARWARLGRPLEALALLEAAGRAGPDHPLRLRLYAALQLYRPLLEATGGGVVVPARLRPELGLARLATGDPEGAIPLLEQAIRGRPRWGAWMRAAAALASIAPERAEPALAQCRQGPLVRLVRAHLAERAGEYRRALALLPEAEAGEGRPAEAALLRATALAGLGERDAAERAVAGALAGFALPPFADEPSSRQDGPVVTVVVAAFDAEATIETALRSLQRQSWRSLDIVVVDDASTDRTAAITAALTARDSRIRLLRQPINRGAYAARNRGLAEAVGEYVTTHDADDEAHPLRIERQLAPLLADARLVGTVARWLRREAPNRFRDRQLAPLIRLHVGSLLLRRRFLVGAVGAYDEVRYGADGDLLTRIDAAAGAGGIARLALPLTVSGVRAGSAVHDPLSGYGGRGYSLERQRYHERSVLRCIAQLCGRPLTISHDLPE